MEKKERHKRFIEAWGQLGPKWGINKTMAQIHALLLASDQPLCYKCIKDELDISMGCINMNLKTLLSWELIYGVDVPGERKEYFVAEKDMWKVFQLIVRKRKEEELIPMMAILDELGTAQNPEEINEDPEFFDTVKDIKEIAMQVDRVLDNVANGENQWLMKGIRMIMR